MDVRRNPYLILGVPYGVSRDEARRAAARRSRQLRDRQGAPYATEDVTWALHQIEQVIDDPESAVEVFRVPAAPGILDAASGTGLFRPPPEPLPRRSQALSDGEYNDIRHAAIAAVARSVITTLGSRVSCWPPEHGEGSS
jgi:hypothetical protein